MRSGKQIPNRTIGNSIRRFDIGFSCFFLVVMRYGSNGSSVGFLDGIPSMECGSVDRKETKEKLSEAKGPFTSQGS